MELNEIRFLLAIAHAHAGDKMRQVQRLAEDGPQPPDPEPLEIEQIRAQGYYAAWADCRELIARTIRLMDEPPEPF